ncbi:hypothetical protein TorRG33x02_205900, partial [Trema orientale]
IWQVEINLRNLRVVLVVLIQLINDQTVKPKSESGILLNPDIFFPFYSMVSKVKCELYFHSLSSLRVLLPPSGKKMVPIKYNQRVQHITGKKRRKQPKKQHIDVYKTKREMTVIPSYLTFNHHLQSFHRHCCNHYCHHLDQ